MRSLFLAAAALSAASGVAHAETKGLEASAGVSFLEAGDAELTGVTGRLAYVINRNFGVEGELSLGVGDDEVGGVSVELERVLGVFAVGYLPIDNRLDFFGRVGFTDIEVEANAGPFSSEGDADGLGFGFGAKYDLDRRIGLRGEYAQYDGDGDDIDLIALSATVRF